MINRVWLSYENRRERERERERFIHDIPVSDTDKKVEKHATRTGNFETKFEVFDITIKYFLGCLICVVNQTHFV